MEKLQRKFEIQLIYINIKNDLLGSLSPNFKCG